MAFSTPVVTPTLMRKRESATPDDSSGTVMSTKRRETETQVDHEHSPEQVPNESVSHSSEFHALEKKHNETNDEISHLRDQLAQKDALIAELTTKCTTLEEQKVMTKYHTESETAQPNDQSGECEDCSRWRIMYERLPNEQNDDSDQCDDCTRWERDYDALQD